MLGSTSQVSNCTNSGGVTGNGNYIGGIAGIVNTSATISNCSNNGEVTGNGNYTGGIVGAAYPYTTILKCNNNAKISSVSEDVNDDSMLVGGIVGNFLGTRIEKCINLGDVLSKSSYKWNRAGGISGWIGTDSDKCEIEECANYGNIRAEGSSTYMCLAGRNCSRLWKKLFIAELL